MSTYDLKPISDSPLQKTILSHFKSSNYLETTAQLHPAHKKVRRDRSAMSNYVTPEKINNSTIDITNRNTTKSLLQSNLPDINSKHRSQKRSCFLQMWLDEALDPQDHSNKGGQQGQSKIEVEKTGPLKTVQKFEIDKKYLRSQNISPDAIDKLYNSLYIYTYGINNTFEEILSLTKLSEYTQKKIINSFWKAFIKLLQGCTSYRTVFQVVEETHIKNLIQLKELFVKKQAKFYEQQKQRDDEIQKLNKKLNQLSYNYTKLSNDYSINQATLQLTDQAFNDEVNLRLKFQEKVNAMFNAYEEIRSKYEKLLGDLQTKGVEELESHKKEIILKNKVQKSEIKIIDLEKKLIRNQQIINERNDELELKRQEIFQLSNKLKDARDNKEENQEEVRKIISRLNAFKQKSEEHKSEADAKGFIIKELEARIAQMEGLVLSCRDANQKVYEKYQISGKKVGDFQGIKICLQAKIQSLQYQKQSLDNRLKEVDIQASEYKQKSIMLDEKLKLAEDDLKLKKHCIQKNTQKIGDLKAVNDKLERLYEITQKQKNKIQINMNQAMQLSQKFSQQMKGMKMLLQNKAIELNEANSKLENERQVFRSKINSLKEQIQLKQKQVLSTHNQQIQNQQNVRQTNIKIQQINIQFSKVTNQKLQLQAEMLQVKEILTQLQTQRISNRELIHSLNLQIQSINKQNISFSQTLIKKEFIITEKTQNIDEENRHLRALMNNYRQERERKVNYIHPMLYEDCQQQIDRLTKKTWYLFEVIKQKQNQIDGLNKVIQQKDLQIERLNCQLNMANQTIKEKNDLISAKKQQIIELQAKIDKIVKERIQTEKKNNLKIANLIKQIESLKDRLRQADQQNNFSRSTIKKQNQTVVRLQENKKNTQQKMKQIQYDFTKQTVQINKLKQQVRKGSSKTPLSRIRKLSSRDGDKESVVSSQREDTKQQLFKFQEGQKLGSIKEEQAKEEQYIPAKPKEQINQATKPSKQYATKQTQTDKQKIVKVQLAAFGCQVSILQEQQKKEQTKNQSLPKSPRENQREIREGRKLEGNQFKRALKITYMRR